MVGGGPAGLEAARVAAQRGHRVSLYEKESRLGGGLRLLASVPSRQEMQAPIDWWTQELTRLGVEILLQQQIDSPAQLDADDIVWATGAKPGISGVWRNRPQLIDGIPGTQDCAHTRDVLAGTVFPAGRLLVIDEESGWPAIAAVEALIARPEVNEITVTTDRLLLGLPALQFSVETGRVTRRLKEADVRQFTSTLIAEVADGFATTLDGERLGPFDCVLLSTGPESRQVPDGVAAIGDCVTPRSTWAAVTEGMELGRRL